MGNAEITVQWEIEQLVRSGLYPNEETVWRSALRALFQARPKLRTRMILHAYAAGEISLGKVAEQLGTLPEEAKEILREAGVQIHLGSQDITELRRDADNA